MTARSVHFGLNMVSAEAYNGWIGQLSGCWHDAEDMMGVFAQFGYDARGFFDSECTLDRCRQELTDAAASLVPGDCFVFSDSGHGSQRTGLIFGSEEGLVLYDGILVDSEFRHLLARFKAGVNVVYILDVCHAGGLSRAMPSVRARVAPLHVTRNMRGNPKPDEPVMANVLGIGACEVNQLSYDGDTNGAFTESFLNVKQDGMTWKSWYDLTERYMSQNYPNQHPVFEAFKGPVGQNQIGQIPVSLRS